MEYTRIILERKGPVAFVTMNRPDVHNAFDEMLIGELTAVFRGLGQVGTRVAVLQGAGKSFSAGADLEWMQRISTYTYVENLADAHELQQMFETIAQAPFVTIARVHGAAIGGGLGLVAACDIAIAEDTDLRVPARPKQFGLTEVRLGLGPATIAPYILRKINLGDAHFLFLTGRRFNAAEAHRIGLIQQVVGAGEIDAAVSRIIDDILQSGPAAIAATKRLLFEIEGKSQEDVATSTTRCIAVLRSSEEGQEGVKAFLEKRRPSFSVLPDPNTK